jgi:hypothetical protein
VREFVFGVLMDAKGAHLATISWRAQHWLAPNQAKPIPIAENILVMPKLR